MKRILVCGGRHYADAARIHEVMSSLIADHGRFVLISGMAQGADIMSWLWARGHGLETADFPADWGGLGLSAGPIRNRKMLAEGRPDLVVAFPGNKGTADMVGVARAAGVAVHRVDW